MNAVGVAKFAVDMRPELIDPRTEKLRKWVDQVDKEMHKQIDVKIKKLPHVWDEAYQKQMEA